MESHLEGGHNQALLFHKAAAAVTLALAQKGEMGDSDIKAGVLTVVIRYSKCRITMGAAPLCDWECGSPATRRKIHAVGDIT